MELRGRRPAWRQGDGDGLAQALEWVVAPLLLGALGALLDHVAGTGRWCTVALALVGILGVAVTQYYRYVEKVSREQEGKPWMRRAR